MKSEIPFPDPGITNADTGHGTWEFSEFRNKLEQGTSLFSWSYSV